MRLTIYTDQNKLSSMSVFFHRPNLKFTKFSCSFQKCLKQLKFLTQLKLDNMSAVAQWYEGHPIKNETFSIVH